MPKKPVIAVVAFPGTNCELEALQAIRRNGMTAELVRWNEPAKLKKVDGVIIAGGFSYEDRGRSGLVASRDPLVSEIKKLADRGGVVLGICNGAQVLVETGLVPAGDFGKPVLALTDNFRREDSSDQQIGHFRNAWVDVCVGGKKVNAFNNAISDGQTLRIPIAHGEGRFFSRDSELLGQLVEHGQNAFLYCDEDGEVSPEFPINPNGSVLNLAAVTNTAGNVMAMMPHPERTTAGDPIFQSMRAWILGKVEKPRAKKISAKTPEICVTAKPKVEVELFISLQITDNAAWTVGQAAGVELLRWRWLSLPAQNLKKLNALIAGGSVANVEKETVFVRIGRETYRYEKGKGLKKQTFALPKNRVLVRGFDALDSGVVWATDLSAAKFEAAIKKGILANPVSQTVAKI